VWLAGPESAEKAELEKAAKAMAGRCKAYGYEGVKAAAEAGTDGVLRVRMDVDGGFSEAMVRTIAVMARRAAKTFEMRLYYAAQPGEAEQFPVPPADRFAEAKAPQGARWCGRVRFSADGADAARDPVLMRATPVIGRTELLPPCKDKPDYADYYYVLSEAGESRLRSALKGMGGKFSCEIVVDDVCLVTEVTPTPQPHPKDNRVWWRHTFSAQERKIVDGYRLHAMPFALRVAAAPK
jgi:hypothetical protein